MSNGTHDDDVVPNDTAHGTHDVHSDADTAIRPVGSLSADQVRNVLLAATAAPSLLNTQPWRFRCTPDAIELYTDRDREVRTADPDHREMLLACGAALLNLRLAARAEGAYPMVRLFPRYDDPDLLASVRLQGRRVITPADRELAEAIPRRRTNRRPFHPTAVSLRARNELRRAAEAERAWLAIVSGGKLPDLRNLVHQAHWTQQRDTEFLTEFAMWTGRDGQSFDGVPIRSAGPLPEPQDEWVLRDFSAGTGQRRIPGKDFEPEPLIAVVGSFQDTPPAQLQAGQAMQRVLLTATVHGLSASFLSQVVEVEETRAELRKLLGGGLWPQTVLRIGHGTPVPATPRRSLEDVMELNGKRLAAQSG